ncbi:MAG TPA: hypothetical protein VFY71_18130 [Planctomycetota bacterium]|nr:hypothetical protein [Planctomycetota bacterium]
MQHRRPTYLALCTLALCAGALAFGPGGGKEDSQSCLVRPDGASDDNAKGTLRIRSQGNSERFDVHIMKVEPGVEHHLWIQDPIDSDPPTFTDLGDLPGDGGSQKLALDTKKGDTLPLGVTTTTDLIGRLVEIRQGDIVELGGEVPPYGLSKKPEKVKETVTAADTDPQPDIVAKLELRSKANKGQERIIVTLTHVDFSAGPFDVFVEDAVGSGVFVNVGDLEQLSNAKGRYRRDCKKGQALPAGVMFVSELSGRTLQVRDGADTVFLSTVIPQID